MHTLPSVVSDNANVLSRCRNKGYVGRFFLVLLFNRITGKTERCRSGDSPSSLNRQFIFFSCVCYRTRCFRQGTVAFMDSAKDGELCESCRAAEGRRQQNKTSAPFSLRINQSYQSIAKAKAKAKGNSKYPKARSFYRTASTHPSIHPS